jgi:hypothetical protein
MVNLSVRLRQVVALEDPLLNAIADSAADVSPRAGAWSKKQELGHLIDSATNNRVRFIKAALEGKLDGPSYDARGWVDMGGYADMSWSDLAGLWKALNLALAAVLDRIPEGRLQAECRIGDGPSVTLEFVIDDYILHMQHHLDRILSRERVTAYPSA